MKVIKFPTSYIFKNGTLKDSISTTTEISTDKSTELSLDFSNISEIRKGDLLVLFAQIEKVKEIQGKKIYRKGRLPSHKDVKRLLTSKNMVLRMNQILPPNITFSDKLNFVDPNTIDSFFKGLRKIGIDNKTDIFFSFHSRITGFFTEIVANAVEHGIKNRRINCWMAYDIDYKSKKVTYTFVDMGYGIVNSHKKEGIPFKYKFLSNYRIVLDSLNGNLRSSTKESNRGKGLPEIKKIIEDKVISDFVLITNRFSFQYSNNKFKITRNKNFVGTYYSFTIDNENFERWKSIQYI